MKLSAHQKTFYQEVSELCIAYARLLCHHTPGMMQEDLAQDVLVNLLKVDLYSKAIDHHTSNTFNLEGYVFRAVKNRFLHYLKERNHPTELHPEILPYFEMEVDKLDQPDLEVLIWEYVEENPKHRLKIEAFLKQHLEGKSGEEIALEYNISPNLVYQWVARAKYHLAAFLTSKGISPENLLD
ncbi:MAG: sigma-70 family RNA polymerase sigma factor [Saprospiraceae bacterium]|nr:sigma-70 family RNA polymerase sigma factor [Saprospiraceae bacterium]